MPVRLELRRSYCGSSGYCAYTASARITGDAPWWVTVSGSGEARSVEATVVYVVRTSCSPPRGAQWYPPYAGCVRSYVYTVRGRPGCAITLPQPPMLPGWRLLDSIVTVTVYARGGEWEATIHTASEGPPPPTTCRRITAGHTIRRRVAVGMAAAAGLAALVALAAAASAGARKWRGR